MEQTGESGGVINFSLTEEDNQRLLINKTAVLISAAMRIGAILGKAPQPVEEALASYGLAVGIAFQMVDDCLDYIGDEQDLRKAIGTDLKEGKVTLPLIYTLGRCTPPEKKQIQDIMLSEQFPPHGLQRIITLINKYEGFAYAFSQAQRFIEEGKERLSILPASREKDALIAGANYVVRRRE